MKRLILILALISTSFILSQEKNIEVPQIIIKLPIGETLHLNAGSITFIEVIEDSRCPKDLNCVWAGRAKVIVTIKYNNERIFNQEIIFGELLEGEATNTILFSTEDHIINSIDLYPLPSSKTDTENRPYKLLIHIEKK